MIAPGTDGRWEIENIIIAETKGNIHLRGGRTGNDN